MTAWYRSLLRPLGITLLLMIALALALAALFGGVVLLLPGTVVVRFDVTIVARNADGTLVPGQRVELWGYDKYTRESVTGADGRAEFPGEVIHVVATLAFPRQRPDVFPVHIRFPAFAPSSTATTSPVTAHRKPTSSTRSTSTGSVTTGWAGSMPTDSWRA